MYEGCWKEVELEGKTPVTREGATLTNVNKKLIMFGGLGQEIYNDTNIIDSTKLKWIPTVI